MWQLVRCVIFKEKIAVNGGENCLKFRAENWRVPNPPGANPLVAGWALWRSLQSRVPGGQQPLGNPYRFLSFLLHTWQPLCDPNSYSWGRLFQLPGVPKGPRRTKKYYAVVNLLSVVNLLPHSDLLSRRTPCGHHFPGNCRHFSSQRRVCGVVNLWGVVKNTTA